MPQSPCTESVRELAKSEFAALGPDKAGPISESVLVSNGYITGRSFRHGSAQIVWFFDAAEMKVYDANGKLLKVISLSETCRKAA